MQGDYYYLRRMDANDKDVSGSLLNKDRTFGIPYKVGRVPRPARAGCLRCWGRARLHAAAVRGGCLPAPVLMLPRAWLACSRPRSLHTQDFVTGPSKTTPYGEFAIDLVTGEGYAFATDTWANAPGEPVDDHCVDTWTLAPIAVPIAGLTPYPGDVRGQPDWAAQVVVTPVSLLTLGDISPSSVTDKYDAAYASVGVPAKGGMYGGGMVNSDPTLMVASGNAEKAAVGVGALVASAKSLGVLSLARSLYECRDGAGARLSNELFNQARLPGGRVGGSAMLH